MPSGSSIDALKSIQTFEFERHRRLGGEHSPEPSQDRGDVEPRALRARPQAAPHERAQHHGQSRGCATRAKGTARGRSNPRSRRSLRSRSRGRISAPSTSIGPWPTSWKSSRAAGAERCSLSTRWASPGPAMARPFYLPGVFDRGDGFRRPFAGYRQKSSLRSRAAGRARPMRNPFRSSGGSI